MFMHLCSYFGKQSESVCNKSGRLNSWKNQSFRRPALLLHYWGSRYDGRTTPRGQTPPHNIFHFLRLDFYSSIPLSISAPAVVQNANRRTLGRCYHSSHQSDDCGSLVVFVPLRYLSENEEWNRDFPSRDPVCRIETVQREHGKHRKIMHLFSWLDFG